jgi:hypothetical protein
MSIVTIALHLLTGSPGRILASIYQDLPQYKRTGAQAELSHDEVAELLEGLGSSREQAQEILERVRTARVHRRQYKLSPEQEGRARQVFPEGW